jgi:hypothetical protein
MITFRAPNLSDTDPLMKVPVIKFPQFQKKYGVQLEEGGYTITAEWQLALSLVALLGNLHVV